MVKKVLAWAFVAFIIFFIAYRPQPAAKVFRAIFSAFVAIFTGFGSFLQHLFT